MAKRKKQYKFVWGSVNWKSRGEPMCVNCDDKGCEFCDQQYGRSELVDPADADRETFEFIRQLGDSDGTGQDYAG